MTRPSVSLVLTSITAALLAGLLNACIPLVVGGAAVGAMVFVDRRTSGTQLEDENIELRAASRLRDALGDRVHVNVASYNRRVLLTGEARTAQDREAAEQTAARVENVRTVVNEIAVMPHSSMQGRSNDLLITSKVKATFIDAKDLQVNAFRVVTERGVVHLMGRVSQAEADRATQITRTISGVQRVVRIFDIMTQEEFQRLSGDRAQPSQRPAGAP